MEERRQILLGFGISDHAACIMAGRRDCYIPKAVGLVAGTFDVDGTIFGDEDVVLGKDGGAVIVAELPYGEKGACGKGIQDVTCACYRRYG